VVLAAIQNAVSVAAPLIITEAMGDPWSEIQGR
jgi:hypothetical protein